MIEAILEAWRLFRLNREIRRQERIAAKREREQSQPADVARHMEEVLYGRTVQWPNTKKV